MAAQQYGSLLDRPVTANRHDVSVGQVCGTDLSDSFDSLLASDDLTSALIGSAHQADASHQAAYRGALGLHKTVPTTHQVELSLIESPSSRSSALLHAIHRVQALPCFKPTRRRAGRTRILTSVRRSITNNTYLRRLYISSLQAQSLFPSMKFDAALMSPRHRRMLGTLETAHKVALVNSAGQRWAVDFECAVSKHGQLHCRLVHGWSTFCRDNGVRMHDVIVLRSLPSEAHEVEVCIDRGTRPDVV